MKTLAAYATQILAKADITVNGDRPFDIQIHNDRVYSRVFFEGALGFGESYMDGDWDCEDLAELTRRLVLAGGDQGNTGITGTITSLSNKFQNAQTQHRARRDVSLHYDIGNDLYQAMLDKRLVYTCGYWKDATTLDAAQEAKLDLVCRKLGLKAGQRILDIGCGWGSFAKFAVEKYGVEVVGITLSKEQIALGEELCEGLPVQLLLMDYRDLPRRFPAGHFDHIVSIGMFEHVGPKNYRAYMEAARAVLKPEGLFLLHTIGGMVGGANAWLDKYIFPNGYIPSLQQITRALRDRFIVEDLHNFGAYYDTTLSAWWENFDRAWPALKASGEYDDRFYRMWRFYLLTCAGTFRARATELWQFVLSPHGVPGGYQSVR